jgi:hypothetical protein
LGASGNSNTAYGSESLFSNESGYANTSIGHHSGYSNTSGFRNTIVGDSALRANTTGVANTAVGYNTIPLNVTGNRITAVGSGADVAIDGLNNSTVIGFNASVSTDNTMSFGNNNTVKWVFGIATTSAAGRALEVGFNGANGNGAYLTTGGTWTNASDLFKKEELNDINGDDLLQRVKQLTVQRWKYKGTNEYHIGPYAQDFNKLFAVGTDDKSISSIDPAGVSLAAIKELIILIEKQDAVIKDLQEKIKDIGKN